MASQPSTLLTPDEYLELEVQTEYRNEYLNGEVFAMAGASVAHGHIALNISWRLASQLEGSPCAVQVAELRIRTGDRSMYTYPDVVVFCGKADIEKYKGTDTVGNPTVIIEVLSPSTEAYDRGVKFQRYQGIATLMEYVLVSQDKVLLERYVRQSNGEWLYSSVNSLEDSLQLSSVPARLKLSDVYQRVFPVIEDSK